MMKKIAAIVALFTMLLTIFPVNYVVAGIQRDIQIVESTLSDSQMSDIIGSGSRKRNLKGYVIDDAPFALPKHVPGASVSSCNGKHVLTNSSGYYYLSNVQSGGSCCNYVQASKGSLYGYTLCSDVGKCSGCGWKKGTHRVDIHFKYPR